MLKIFSFSKSEFFNEILIDFNFKVELNNFHTDDINLKKNEFFKNIKIL
jgi:hypothetical protein